MNRSRKRKIFPMVPKPKKNFQTSNTNQFAEVPTITIVESIHLLLNELNNRGLKVYDFDNDSKYLQGFKYIRSKIFFLSAGEVQSESEKQ